jgi:hypothetical protein
LWADPDAKKAFVMGGVDYTIYSRVYAGFTAGLPVWEQLVISVEDAKAVNIPPSDLKPGERKQAVPVPMRELTDDEVVKLGFGAVPQVWTADEMQSAASVFTAAEKDLLLAAARRILEG